MNADFFNLGLVAAVCWSGCCIKHVFTKATCPPLDPISSGNSNDKGNPSVVREEKKQMPAHPCLPLVWCVCVLVNMCVMATEDNDTPDDGPLSA